MSRQVLKAAGSGLLFTALIGVAMWLARSEEFGRSSAFAWGTGAVFGLALQRARFCFFCHTRDWIDTRESSGVLAILLALGIGLLGYHIVVGAWIVDPAAGYLPPKAHIAPLGIHLAVGGFVFGLGMALSGSCISGHLYRLGEGSMVCLIALAAVVPGFMVGFLSWNYLYLHVLATAPVLWLPKPLGFTGALLIQLSLLATVGFLLWRKGTPVARRGDATASPRTFRASIEKLFIRRWPAWTGGLIVGLLAAAVLLRAEPLGVTSEIARLARHLGDWGGLLPARLEGLDTLRGCTLRSSVGVLSDGTLFLLALVAASFTGAWTAGDITFEWPGGREIFGAIGGGLLLGWGAMISLGCTVGTFLSGIHASSLSGWLFGAFLIPGILLGLPARRWMVRSREATRVHRGPLDRSRALME